MKRFATTLMLALAICQPVMAVEYLKQSTAVTLKIGPFVDETDGKTAETALTLSQADFRLSKNGGDFAQKNESTSGTHDEIGYYDVPVNTTDTGTLGRLLVAVHESGALPVWKEYMVLPANTYDSLVSGSDALNADVDEWNGTAIPGVDTAGYPKVTIKDGTGTGEIDTSSGLVKALDPARRLIFVSSAGNDSNDGLSPSTAKLTLNGAAAVAAAGDRVYVFNGTYSGQATWGVNGCLIEGQSRTGVVITHNTDTTMTVSSTNKLTLRNLTITASVESGANEGVGLVAHNTTFLHVENCAINGHFDAAQFNGSVNLYVAECTITGSYDALNATDVQGVFERNKFVSTTTSNTTAGSKSAFRCPAASNATQSITLRDNDFVVLQIVSNNTGDLIACAAQGNLNFEGNNRFQTASFDADFSGDMIGLRVGDQTNAAYCRINSASFLQSTVGSNNIYNIQAQSASSKIDVANNPLTAYTLNGSGTINYIAPTATSINSAVVAGTVGTNQTTLLSRLSATRAGYLDNLSAGPVAQASALDTVDNYLDTEIAAIASSIAAVVTATTPIAAFDVDDRYTWRPGSTADKADRVITVSRNFAGPLAAEMPLNEFGAIESVTSVAITGAATPTATNLRKSGNGREAIFNVPSLTTAGTYTVLITVETVDEGTVPMTCKLIVR